MVTKKRGRYVVLMACSVMIAVVLGITAFEAGEEKRELERNYETIISESNMVTVTVGGEEE